MLRHKVTSIVVVSLLLVDVYVYKGGFVREKKMEKKGGELGKHIGSNPLELGIMCPNKQSKRGEGTHSLTLWIFCTMVFERCCPGGFIISRMILWHIVVPDGGIVSHSDKGDADNFGGSKGVNRV